MKNKLIVTIIAIVVIASTIIFAMNLNYEKDGKFNIVTSFYPVYIATLNITDGIENVTVSNLTSQTTGCIHDYVLSTSDLIMLDNADALIINGASMEEFMDKVILNFENLKIIDSSLGIDVIYEECDEEEHEHHEHEHDHESNPHIFVSVKNYIKQIQNICNELIQLDEQHKAKYEANAKAYIESLELLDNEITVVANNLENKNIVTFHNSFDYFAKDYGFKVIGTIETEHGKTPSAGEIASLVETIRENSVKAIFVEPEYNELIVDTISRETGVKVYKLNPVTSGNINKDEYLKIMQENLAVLKEALS